MATSRDDRFRAVAWAVAGVVLTVLVVGALFLLTQALIPSEARTTPGTVTAVDRSSGACTVTYGYRVGGQVFTREKSGPTLCGYEPGAPTIVLYSENDPGSSTLVGPRFAEEHPEKTLPQPDLSLPEGDR